MAQRCRSIHGMLIEAELASNDAYAIYRARRDIDGELAEPPEPVAVKVAHELAELEPLTLSRARREACTLTRLSCSALPQMYTFGLTEDGRPFTAFELVTAPSLREVLSSNGPLSLEQGWRLLADLVAAVRALHVARIAHGNVSSEQVRVRSEAEPSYCLSLVATAGAKDRGAAGSSHSARWNDRVRADLNAVGEVVGSALGWEELRLDTADSVPARGSEAALRYLVARLCATGAYAYGSAVACFRDLWAFAPAMIPEPYLDLFEPPPVGRYAELMDLESAVDAAVGVAVAIVYGQPGMGKTRLLEELSRRAVNHRVTLATFGKHDEIRALGTISRLFQQYLDDAALSKRGQRVERLLEFAGSNRALLQLLALPNELLRKAARGPLPTSDEMIAEGLAEIVLKVLNELGPRLTLMVDDFQWVDEASQRVLRRVVEELSELRDGGVLLVCASRDELESRLNLRRFVEATTLSPALTLELRPLTAGQTVSLVRDYLGPVELDSESEQALAFVSDGSPLTVSQVLQAVFDRGYLVPDWGRWRMDVYGVARMQLSSETSALLVQRVEQLSERARELLHLAAVLGCDFQLAWLEAAFGDAVAVASGLEDALAAQVLNEARDGRLHFVHQALRDALLEQLPQERRRALHEQVLEALLPDQPIEVAADERVYMLAEHALSAGLRDEELGLRLCLEAGRRAHRAFDSARCIFFLQAVEGERLGVADRRQASYLLGEALLRAGRFEDSLTRFAVVAAGEGRDLLRARAWSRMAWVGESRFDSVAAWEHLQRAYEALGARVPEMRVSTAVPLLRGVFDSPEDNGTATPVDERAELLCRLHLQTARLTSVTEEGGRCLAAIALAMQTARRGVSPATMSRAQSGFAVFSAILGWHGRAERQLRASRRVADAAGDFESTAQALQLASICACWRGDVVEALRVCSECVDRYGHWVELWEYYLLIANQQLLESLLGRGRHAWKWIHRAGRRLLQAERNAAFPDLFYHGAYAAALNQGCEQQFERLLVAVQESCRETPADSAFKVLTYGARLRRYTEVYRFDAGFEAIVAEFEQQSYDPRRVHLVAVEYYVHLAHARLEQALRLPAAKRAAFLPTVTRAVRDLERAARVQLVRAHALVCRATLCVLQGREAEAERGFDAAQALAAAESAPWVLWAVLKGRAHLAQQRGQLVTAQDYAHLAVVTADKHGAVHRVAAVRGHFPRDQETLAPAGDGAGAAGAAVDAARAGVEAARAGRQLAAMLRVGQVSARELNEEHQAREVLDETIAALRARRGFLWMRQADARSGFVPLLGKRFALVAARSADNDDLTVTSAPDVRKVLGRLGNRRVLLWEQPVNLDGGPPRTVMAAALVVNQQMVGVVSIEGPIENCPFSVRDADLLLALAGHATLVLELARALYNRDRLVEELRHAQKMDAVGRLAGGMAHDFNNMTAAIQVAVDAATQLIEPHCSAIEELETIRRAATRSSDVTQRLLSFSRRQMMKCRPLDLSQLIASLTPTIRRLIGPKIEITAKLATDLYPIYADASQLEQVLINLAINARDAMPEGGELTIVSRNRYLDSGRGPDLLPGHYVQVEVRDTGLGMDARVRRRIFEPYFTTKPEEQGTGLGMSMSYGIIRQSGGDIAVESRPGEGTQFTILLPRGDKVLGQAHEVPVLRTVEPVSLKFNGEPVVLLVEDDALLRGALDRTLTRSGFRVLAAPDGPAALVAARGSNRIDVVVIDLILPEMNGLDLARDLLRMGVFVPFLYMSGHPEQLLTEAEIARADLLRKPMSSREFVARVQAALARSKTAPKPLPRLRLIAGPQR